MSYLIGAFKIQPKQSMGELSFSMKSGIAQATGMNVLFSDIGSDSENVYIKTLLMPSVNQRIIYPGLFPLGRIYLVNLFAPLNRDQLATLELPFILDPEADIGMSVLPIVKYYNINRKAPIDLGKIVGISSSQREQLDSELHIESVNPSDTKGIYYLCESAPVSIPDDSILIIQLVTYGTAIHMLSPFIDAGFGRERKTPIRLELVSMGEIPTSVICQFYPYKRLTD